MQHAAMSIHVFLIGGGIGSLAAAAFMVRDGGVPGANIMKEGDLVLMQNGSMTDASSMGSLSKPPALLTKADSGGWTLWEKLAQGGPEFGNLAAFNSCVAQSCGESFTVTLKTPAFFIRRTLRSPASLSRLPMRLSSPWSIQCARRRWRSANCWAWTAKSRPSRPTTNHFEGNSRL